MSNLTVLLYLNRDKAAQNYMKGFVCAYINFHLSSMIPEARFTV